MAEQKDDGLRSDGFLSRWARRKQDVLAGKPVAEPVAKPSAVRPIPLPVEASDGGINKAAGHIKPAQAATDTIATTNAEKTTELPPPPTLQDAGALTPASDFKPFMASNVSPEVKNAAMKKLFADPHYNIMDMMDTYVDDYSKPDPIPDSMLRQLASVKFLRLFERDEEEGAKAGGEKVDGKPLAAAQLQEPLNDAAADTDSLQTALATPALPDTPNPTLSAIPQGIHLPSEPASTVQPKHPLMPHTP